jgi:hypothetical protein
VKWFSWGSHQLDHLEAHSPLSHLPTTSLLADRSGEDYPFISQFVCFGVLAYPSTLPIYSSLVIVLTPTQTISCERPESPYGLASRPLRFRSIFNLSRNNRLANSPGYLLNNPSSSAPPGKLQLALWLDHVEINWGR